jgi:hypothetical protein
MEPMEIGAKELYDAIQRMGVEFDTKWAELDQKISAHMQSFVPEIAKLDLRVTQLEKARERDATRQQWSTGMKVTVTSLVASVVLSIVLGVLNLTVGG